MDRKKLPEKFHLFCCTMYEEYFGFTSPPFSIAPDPHYLYMSDRHREALAHLLYGIRSNSGFVLLTGEVGTGKTTVCRCLLEQIPENTDIAFILNPKLTVEELLATICEEFNISLQGNQNSIKVFVDHINSFLLNSHARGRKAVLIIDEAQNLSVDVLEQIRLLTNLETNERKLLQIIMLGQPELKEMLLRSELRQLAQRITARYHLDPLSEKEVGAYVAHRLSVAGGRSKIFPASTIKILYQLSKGTPRLINILCDRTLLGAYVLDREQVSTSILKKAAQEVFGDFDIRPQQNRKISSWAIAALVLLISGSILATGYYYQKPQIEKFFIQESIEQAKAEEKIDRVEPEDPESKIILGKPIDNLETEDNQLLAMEMVKEVIPSELNEEQSPGTDPEIQKEAGDIDNNSQTQEIFTLEWSGEDTFEENKEMAFKALFAKWDVPYLPDKNTNACTFAETFNLRCLNFQGSFDSLLKLNRPAILTLFNDKGERFFATLTSFHGKTATIVIGSESRIVTAEDIGVRWFGDSTLLWSKPQEYIAAIKPGNTTSNVGWLDKKLAFILGHSPSSINPVTFDDTLTLKVKQFQFSRGLVPDGIVGPQTIIHLNSAYGNEVPKLLDTEKDN